MHLLLPEEHPNVYGIFLKRYFFDKSKRRTFNVVASDIKIRTKNVMLLKVCVCVHVRVCVELLRKHENLN